MNLFAITILVALMTIVTNAAPIGQSENSNGTTVSQPQPPRSDDLYERIKKPEETIQRVVEAELPDRNADKTEPIYIDQNTFTLQSIEACLDILLRLQSIVKSASR